MNVFCAIMQPTYLPWIGYFDLIDSVDKFVFYDDVQFSKQSWQCRNKVQTANGVSWLTVPLQKCDLSTNINKVAINYTKPWVKKQLKTIFYNYSKAPYFDEVYSFLENIFIQNKYHYLADLNISIIKAITVKIGITTELIINSTLSNIETNREKKLIEICLNLECSAYISPLGSSPYLESSNANDEFRSHKIKLMYHNYQHPIYQQKQGEFTPYLSIIDLLFYSGFKESLTLIRQGRKAATAPNMLNLKDI